MKLIHWLLLAALVVSAFIVASTFHYPLVTDDPFITYRYARNLLDGNGFVYNPGEHILSTTTPLYTLVLAALGLIFRDIPTLGFWLSVLSYAVCAWFIYRIASYFEMRAAGIVGALLTLVAPGLVLTYGLETGFYLALAFAAIYFYFREQVTLAFALLALLTLTRNDGAVLTAVLAAHFLFRNRRALPNARLRSRFQPFAIYLLILAPWLVFAWWLFGSPFPFTLTAKIAQAQSGLWDSFAIGFLNWLREWLVAQWLLWLLALIGLGWAMQQRSRLLLIAPWALLYLAAYSLLGVAFYAWYVAPLLPVVALFAGIGVARVAEWVVARTQTRFAFAAIVALVGALLIAIEWRANVAAGMQTPSPKVQVYREAADWLAQNTARASSVDALEVGVIGYYDQRRTLDFVGLVDPQRIPYLRARAFAQGVRRAAADYVIAIPPDDWLPDDAWFTTAYRRVKEIRAPGFYEGRPLVIYQRADSGKSVVENRALNLRFEQVAELGSADLFARSVCGGEILPVALHLRALAPMTENLKFTLQLVGAENRVVTQSDTYFPLHEPAPSFVDHQGVLINLNAPAGTYDLILAMYDVTNGERLSLFDANANDVGDFLSLGQVEIRKC